MSVLSAFTPCRYSCDVEQEHYFAAEPQTPSAPKTIAVDLGDVRFDLLTDRSLFSADSLDRGTEFLLRTAPPPPANGPLLDLGCGYGVIAITLARRFPGREIWATDRNRRALDITTRNATELAASTVHVAAPGEIPEAIRFAAIYSNPPIRIGKEELHALLLHWLERLQPGGCAFLVVQRHLGADSLAGWLGEQGYPTTRLRSRQGYRLLQVTAATAAEAPSSPA